MNNKKIEFENTIGDYIEFDDLVVVRLELTGENYPNINRNVIGVKSDGSICWRIALCPDKTGGGHDAYNGLFKHDDELWATNLNGMKYKVDKNNGEIVDKKFVK